MAEATPRGSSYLPARYSEADLEQLLAVGENAGVQLLDLFPIGVPAFDGGSGTWRVTPEQLPTLIEGLIRLPVVPYVKVFPKGLPATEIFDVVFEVGSRRSL
jgi:hypothetical protein